MKKRFLAIILASLMCLAVLPMGAFAVGYTVVLEPTSEYETHYRVSEGLLVVYDGTYNQGVINKQGEFVIPIDEHSFTYFDGDCAFSEGLITEFTDNNRNYLDKTGKIVISTTYDSISPFHEGLALVFNYSNSETGRKVTTCGFIDKTGKLITCDDYDGAYDFCGGFARVYKDGKWGYIDTTGKQVIACQFDPASDFHDGLARVEKDGKWGYVDTTGKQVIACQFDYASDFHDGFADVGKDGKYGYIDTTGKQVIACQFDYTSDFHDGLACVEKDGKWGCIDTTGNIVIPFAYDDHFFIDDGMAVVHKDGKLSILRIDDGNAPSIEPVPATVIASPSAQSVTVNGKAVAFDVYNINGNNYFKLRDLAATLSGTGKQFEVGWDGAKNAISLTSGKAYTPVGGEMASKGSGDKQGIPTTSAIYKDGSPVSFTAYNIDGNNYFKLRDIGAAFSFGVDYDSATNTVVIDTSKGYTAV